MKNFLSSICLLLCSHALLGQHILDTIYANNQKNVALFFPEPIRQGITGSENFVFTFNREKEQYFGLLQATPGEESNLLVINRNGSIFSYIVRYKEDLSKLNYFIPQSQSIGNEKPTTKKLFSSQQLDFKTNNRDYYYERFCLYLLSQKQRILALSRSNNDVILSIENIAFDKEELYFVIRIENGSSLDYDLNFLNLSIETRRKGKKKSLQSLHQEPLFMYGLPARIKKKETKKLVYVVPKFSISNQRKLILELNEKNGERDLKLKVLHRFINNPN
ncbi:DUF4138 domain-containing protein [Maribacter sp. 2308TA10-17]|uniref:DUF4138 domain-containing protein n=1 Tax=Maribacter sp. 2308TA10-17 TaxID=3386276 RepID=UPI0039BD81EA